MDKFLQYAFMCHRLPERSFHCNGKQFPLCARCTGIMAGYVIGLLILATYGRLSLLLSFALIIPMIVDGTGQLFHKWESNNIRRLITGIMGGISIDFIIINITTIFVNLGREFGRAFFL
ncbi:DUF2085 domain-containing protein [Lysinibacillus telephonicus]|uniref:DUF2085 domain-containing protein n=1 Tax=Lysinibacillus telephonicus TaxID=1714840 RepID=A0A431UP90_9BACI|nr:DUF2085 domain-containing protein [Lysinibacillus telephonicus]